MLRARAAGDVRRLAELLSLRAAAVPAEQALPLLRERAGLLLDAGESLLAAQAFDDYLAKAGDDVDALSTRAELAATGGGPNAAQPYDRRLLAAGGESLPVPVRVRTHLRLGHASLSSGAFRDAAESFEAVVALEPEGERGQEALSLLAEVYNRTKDAKGLYRTSLKLARKADPTTAEVLYRRAADLFEDPKDSIDALLHLTRLRPADASIIDRAVTGLRALGRPADLLAVYEAGAQASGGSRAAELLLAAADIAAGQLDDPRRAMALRDRAAEADPTNVAALKARVDGLRKRGDQTALLEALERLVPATEDADEASLLRLELASLAAAAGREPLARETLEAVVARGVSGAGYADALEALEPLLAEEPGRLAEVRLARAELLSNAERRELLLSASREFAAAGRTQEALSSARAAVAVEADVESLRHVATLHQAVEEPGRAAQALLQAARLAYSAQRPALWLEAAELWESAGENAEALEVLERLASEAPGTLAPAELAERFHRLGASARAVEVGFGPALESGDLPGALALAERAGDAARVRQALWALVALPEVDAGHVTDLSTGLRAEGDWEGLLRLAELLAQWDAALATSLRDEVLRAEGAAPELRLRALESLAALPGFTERLRSLLSGIGGFPEAVAETSSPTSGSCRWTARGGPGGRGGWLAGAASADCCASAPVAAGRGAHIGRGGHAGPAHPAGDGPQGAREPPRGAWRHADVGGRQGACAGGLREGARGRSGHGARAGIPPAHLRRDENHARFVVVAEQLASILAGPAARGCGASGWRRPTRRSAVWRKPRSSSRLLPETPERLERARAHRRGAGPHRARRCNYAERPRGGPGPAGGHPPPVPGRASWWCCAVRLAEQLFQGGRALARGEAPGGGAAVAHIARARRSPFTCGPSAVAAAAGGRGRVDALRGGAGCLRRRAHGGGARGRLRRGARVQHGERLGRDALPGGPARGLPPPAAPHAVPVTDERMPRLHSALRPTLKGLGAGELRVFLESDGRRGGAPRLAGGLVLGAGALACFGPVELSYLCALALCLGAVRRGAEPARCGAGLRRGGGGGLPRGAGLARGVARAGAPLTRGVAAARIPRAWTWAIRCCAPSSAFRAAGPLAALEDRVTSPLPPCPSADACPGVTPRGRHRHRVCFRDGVPRGNVVIRHVPTSTPRRTGRGTELQGGQAAELHPRLVDGGFDFSGTFSRDSVDGGVWFTVDGFSRTASFDAPSQRYVSTHRASAQIPSCGESCKGAEIEETISSGGAERQPGTRALAAGSGQPADAGLPDGSVPGPTVNGYERRAGLSWWN